MRLGSLPPATLARQAPAVATDDAAARVRAPRLEDAPDPASMRRGLTPVRGYPGVTGPISSCGSGDPSRGVVISRIHAHRTRFLRRTGPRGDACPGEVRP